jgi:hypothetical protein
MPVFQKAFSFGVLNNSQADKTEITIRAIVSPSLHCDVAQRAPALALSERDNAEQFRRLIAMPHIAHHLQVRRLRLGIPTELGVALGPIVEVPLGGKPEQGPRELLSTLGQIPRELIPERFEETPPIRRSIPLAAVKRGVLQVVALGVSFGDPAAYALSVFHRTSADRCRIGDLAVLFLPDQEKF